MNRNLTTRELKQLLNHSAGQLDQNISDGLLAARHSALQHQQAAHQAPMLAWLIQHGLAHHPVHAHRILNWGMASLLAAMLLLGISLYWQHEHDHAEIDIAILTDDLPVDVYVD